MIVQTVVTDYDDDYAVGLLVAAFNNPGLADHPLADDLQVRAANIIKARWAANEVAPENPAAALAYFLTVAWVAMTEEEKLVWQQRLIEACK